MLVDSCFSFAPVSPTYFFPHEQDTIYTPGIDKGGRVDLFLLQSMFFKLLVDLKVVLMLAFLNSFQSFLLTPGTQGNDA